MKKSNTITSIFLIIVFFLMTGCKKTVILENSVQISNIAGNAGSVTEYSFEVPSGTEGIMIQVSGSPNVLVKLLNGDRLPLDACTASNTCILSNPEDDKYFVQITGQTDFTNVSVVAAWAQAGTALIKSGIPIQELSADDGAVLLKTTFVGTKIDSFSVNFSEQYAEIQVMNRFGDIVLSCITPSACYLPEISAGLYFVRIAKIGGYNNAQLEVSWGGAPSATLSNGVTLTGLNGEHRTAYDQLFYLEAPATSLIVRTSDPHNVFLEVYDQNGRMHGACPSQGCVLQTLKEGLYHVRLHYELAQQGVSLSTTWGSPTETTLTRGEVAKNLDGVKDTVSVQSFYISEFNAENVSIQASYENISFIEVLNEDWQLIGACNQNHCLFSSLERGVYFTRIYFDQDIPDFDLLVDW